MMSKRMVFLVLFFGLVGCGPGLADEWNRPINIVGDIYLSYSPNEYQKIIIQKNGVVTATIDERVDDYSTMGSKLFVAQRFVSYDLSQGYAKATLGNQCYYYSIDTLTNEILEIQLEELPINVDCDLFDDE